MWKAVSYAVAVTRWVVWVCFWVRQRLRREGAAGHAGAAAVSGAVLPALIRMPMGGKAG
eukprot:COSAG02_NODE_47648_length_339_cov_2.995833_1_plen_58_part_01